MEPERCKHGTFLTHRCRDCENEPPTECYCEFGPEGRDDWKCGFCREEKHV